MLGTVLHLLEPLGIWGSIPAIALLIAYLGQGQGEGPERLNAALTAPWVMRTSVAAALLAWVATWLAVVMGHAYLRGTGRRPWVALVFVACILASAAIALAGIKRWPRYRPWPTYLTAVAMILCTRSASGPAPPVTAAWDQQHFDVEGITFVQERLTWLGCFDDLKGDSPQAGTFDAPTAEAVINFQMTNHLLDDRQNGARTVRREPEFRKLADPFEFRLRPCPR